MTLSPEILLTIGLAFMGVLGIGALMFGISFLAGLVLVILNIYKALKPDTTALATVSALHQFNDLSLERYKTNRDDFGEKITENKAQIEANRVHADNNFNIVFNKLEEQTRTLTGIAVDIATIRKNGHGG